MSISVALHHVCFRVWNMFCRECLPHMLASVCFTVEFSCFDHPPFSITSEPAGPSPTQMERFPSVSPLHACHQFFRSVILQSLCRLAPFTDEDTLRLAGGLPVLRLRQGQCQAHVGRQSAGEGMSECRASARSAELVHRPWRRIKRGSGDTEGMTAT